MVNEIQNTMIQQLGGMGKLKAMVGASQFSALTKYELAFKFKGSGMTNCVKITLNALDLYDIEFFRIRGSNIKPVASFLGVYAESLRGLFEETTGLYLSL